jgi:acyl carrier protein
MSTIIEDLTAVFREVFDNNDIVLTPEMTANDIEGWDSFSHMNMIVAVEIKFKITFKQKEIYGFNNVGDLINSIQGKLPQSNGAV